MLKRLLVAVTMVAFAFGVLTLGGCAKKKTEETTPSGGMEQTPPAESGMSAMPETGMAMPDTTKK